MPLIDPAFLPKRDARGRFLEAPAWLKPGWKYANERGFGLGGVNRKRCVHGTCRDIPLRGSEFCHHHDRARQLKRQEELRTGKGKPMTPAESTRLYRANARNLWRHAPWTPMATIWLAPKLEAGFAVDCRNAGLSLSQTAPVLANTLRWAWRRSVLNFDDDPGWRRALAAARERQAKLAAMPESYNYQAPSATAPEDPRIKIITRRAAAWEPARAAPPVDRTTKAKARRQRQAPPTASGPARVDFDWRAFQAAHWREVFGPLFHSLRIDPEEADGEIGRQLAVAWHAVLDELEQAGGAVGPAQKHWHELLRRLKPI